MKENDLLSKLIRVERVLSVYDTQSEDLAEQVEVKISVDEIKLAVTPKFGDDDLSLPYELEEGQLRRLNELIGNLIRADFEKNYYVLEAYGIYNW